VGLRLGVVPELIPSAWRDAPAQRHLWPVQNYPVVAEPGHATHPSHLSHEEPVIVEINLVERVRRRPAARAARAPGRIRPARRPGLGTPFSCPRDCSAPLTRAYGHHPLAGGRSRDRARLEQHERRVESGPRADRSSAHPFACPREPSAPLRTSGGPSRPRRRTTPDRRSRRTERTSAEPPPERCKEVQGRGARGGDAD